MNDARLTADVDSQFFDSSDRHSSDHHDRRDVITRSLNHLRRILTEQQLMTIGNYERFGWKYFIRNFKSDSPVTFIVSPDDTKSVMLIDEGGELIADHGIVYRP